MHNMCIQLQLSIIPHPKLIETLGLIDFGNILENFIYTSFQTLQSQKCNFANSSFHGSKILLLQNS